MAVTVTPLLTTVNNANSTTGWTSDGGWRNLAVDNAIFREGGSALRGQISQGTGHIYFTLGTAVNLTVATNSRIYAWVLPPGSFGTLANGGLRVVVGDGTNRAAYYVGGNDSKLFTVGVWICIVLDINNRPANFATLAGSEANINFAAITQIGIGIQNPEKAVGNSPNAWFDVVRYGRGLRITGGGVGTEGKFSEIAADDASFAAGKAYGIIREIQTGLYGIQGDLVFGNSADTSTLLFKDNLSIVVIENIVKNTGTNTDIQITGEHNATGNYEFNLGIAVGAGDSQSGRNGVIFVNSNSSQNVNFDFSNQNIGNFNLFGCSLNNITKNINFSSDAVNAPNHKLSGCSFAGCNQINLGRVPTRNCIFSRYSGVDAALLWNVDIDIKNSSILGNTDTTNSPAGIQHPAVGTFSYFNLTFDGNDFDIYNSSGGTVTILATGGLIPTTDRTPVGTTVIENPITHTVVDLEPGSRVVWIRQSDEVELANMAEAGGVASYSYNFAGNVNVWVQILSLNFRNKIVQVTLGAADATLPAAQEVDRFYLPGSI